MGLVLVRTLPQLRPSSVLIACHSLPLAALLRVQITVYVTDDISSGSWKFLGNALEVAVRTAMAKRPAGCMGLPTMGLRNRVAAVHSPCLRAQRCLMHFAQDRPPGTLFRPHAIFNPVTKLYVLYWNYVHPSGAYAGNAAATATTPAGPFTVQVRAA